MIIWLRPARKVSNMDGFKDSTKTKYMCGGPVKKAGGGGVFNEKGKRATLAEIAAEDRRMAGRPSEGVSSRPTDSSGRRASNADLGMTASAKKPLKKAMGGSVSDKPMSSMPPPDPNTPRVYRPTVFYGDGELPTPKPKPKGVELPTPKPAPTISKGPRRPQPPIMVKGPVGPKPAPIMVKGPGQPPPPPTKGAPDMYEPLIARNPVPYSKGGSAKKGVPAYSGKPMIGRKAGGLSVMPKGKC